MVERGGLENRYTFTGIGGSNPPLSATAGNVPVRWLAKPSSGVGMRPTLSLDPWKRLDPGEMAEWLKAHAWKACVR